MDRLPKILVVDDDPSVVRAIARALRGCAEIIEANSVTEARNVIERERPFTLLVDLTLTDGDGFDVLNYARQHGAGTAARIISGRGELVNKAIDHGVAFMLKPVDSRQWTDFSRQLVDFVAQSARKEASLEDCIADVLAEWTRRYRLTKAERELLAAAISNNSRKDLTDALGKGSETIKSHTRNLCAKTGHEKLSAAVVALLKEALSRQS